MNPKRAAAELSHLAPASAGSERDDDSSRHSGGDDDRLHG